MKRDWLCWLSRVLGIIVILFVLLFSLDTLLGNGPMVERIVGLLVGAIPAVLLVIALVLAWRWELTGGIIYIALSIVGCFFFKSFTSNPSSLIVTCSILIVGIVFIISYVRHRIDTSIES